MAMSATGRRSAAAVVVAAVLCAGIGYDANRLMRAERFNAALARGDLAAMAGDDSERGTFARAYELHRAGEYRDATLLYASLERAADPALRLRAKFNLANLYFEQSVALTAAEGPELGIPMIELAKEGYRGVLREDSDHWDAKHNLSKALAILPDLDDVSSDDDIMPERSPRAPQAARAYDRLP